jgi:hypothetical protein
MNDLSTNVEEPAAIAVPAQTLTGPAKSLTAPVREFVGMRNAIAISAVLWLLIWVLIAGPVLG